MPIRGASGEMSEIDKLYPRSDPVQSNLSDINEVRVVDPVTGGEKGSKLARFDLIPPEALWALAEVYGKGAEKYSERNWQRGYKWSLSVAALCRHLFQWIMGERYDKETGCHHLSQVAWHAFALYTFDMKGLGTNDVRQEIGDGGGVR